MAQYTHDLVHLYLQEIGRFPLLNHSQEIHYGKQVQRLTQLHGNRTALTTTLQREPTIAEWAKAANLSETELTDAIAGGDYAKRKLIEANLRFVVAIAKRYRNRNVDILDLIQEGSLGLERGVEKFDPSKGYKFSTYAYWWIRQSITRYLAMHSRTIRLPSHITEKLSKIRKVQRTLAQQLGRTATLTEIAQTIDLPTAQVREYLLLTKQPLSLDQSIAGSQEPVLKELLASEDASPDDCLTRSMLRQDIELALSRLSERERKILTLRFGLHDGNALSLAQISHQMELSKERVRQLEHQALAHLRRRSQLHVYLTS